MIALLSWMPHDIAATLGWTLIHFLWQGLLLAVLLHGALPLCRSAIARHNCALATLIAMAWAPVATFLVLRDAGSGGTYANTALPIPASWIDAMVLLWLAGVAMLSLRALAGWRTVRALERQDIEALPTPLLQRCLTMQRHLAVTWPVRFLLSRRIDVPMVIGALRPVVLIPVSALANLPPQQLDALILHELAHIRRLDTITNILLVAVQTVLFYHPAVWWVGRQLRIEREHCCDDFAASACGDKAMYAEALISLCAARPVTMPALAATGGRLKIRVARLLETPAEPRRAPLPAVMALALLGLAAASVAIAQAPAQAAYPSRDKSPVTLRPITETHSLPPYPTESIHAQEEGAVLLGVTIGTSGAVTRAAVVKSSGHSRLDTVATQFVKEHWRWQPAVRAGKPVTANTRVNVQFKLKKKPA